MSEETSLETRRESMPKGPRWHVEELLRVTAEAMTDALNAAAAEGFELNRIEFVKELGVRRPQMAFLIFERPQGAGLEDDA